MTIRTYLLFFLLLAGSAILDLSAQTNAELASVAFQERDFTRAATLYEELLAAEPEQEQELQLHIDLANTYFELARFAEATEQARAAIALGENGDYPILSVRAQICLGKILDQIGQMEEANALFSSSLNSLQSIETAPSKDQLEALRRLADLKSTIGQYGEAERLFAEALSVYDRIPEKYPLELAAIHNRLGVHHSILRQFPIAKAHLDTAMMIRQELLPPDDLRIGQLYLSLGVVARNTGDFEQAKADLERSLAIFNALNPQPLAAGNSYYFLAGIYYYQGDYQSAERYFLASRDIYAAAMGGENAPQLPSIYMALAAIDYEWGKYDEARTYIGRTVEFFRRFNNGQDPTFLQALMTASQIELAAGEDAAALAMVQESEAILLRKEEGLAANILSYTAIGDAYCQLGNTARGTEILEDGIRLYANQGQAESYLTANVHFDLCRCYLEQDDYQRALLNLRITRKIQEREFGLRHDGLAATLSQLGMIYEELGQPDSALHYAHQSLQAGHRSFADAKLTATPALDGILSPADFVIHLRRKADLLAKSDSPHHDPATANHHYLLAAELASQLSNTYTSQGARLYFQDQLNPVFQGALANLDQWITVNEQELAEQALHFMESGRAGLLTAVLQGVADQPFAGVPDAIRRRAASLRAQLVSLEAKVNQAQIDTSTSARVAAEPLLKDQLRVQLTYDSLLSVLATDYSDFYALNYQQRVVELADLQASLQSGELLLEYFQTVDQLYVLVVSPKTVSWHAAPWLEEYNKAIALLRQPPRATDYATAPAATTRNYLEQSNLLYEQLIAPIAAVQQASILIVIPHGMLSYVSFSSLSAAVGDDWSAADFLADRVSVQQDYSSTLWATSRNDGRRLRNTQLLALAPNQGAEDEELAGLRSLNFRSELRPLHYSQAEVEAAATHFPGEVLLGTAANEAAFKELGAQAGILHLSMHALVSDSLPLYSHFLFGQSRDSLEDNFLHAFELYQLKLPAEMAVLSACNTGFGRLRAGEGMLSLAHAFRYAGTRSIIMSLWPAEDESTATIIASFYERLARGATKAEALRQAQMAYREQADPYHAHPYFWSHLVAVGDMRPLQAEGFSIWWWLVAVALGVGVLAVARSRRW
ncbi:MAG: CHAT domain-containing protein [Bacteroidota bacterium]